MSRSHAADYATLSERYHVVELFERLYPKYYLNLVEWDRRLSHEDLMKEFRSAVQVLDENPKVASVVSTECKPGHLGVDYVLHRGKWEDRKRKNAFVEDIEEPLDMDAMESEEDDG
jgi:hypothetical protein